MSEARKCPHCGGLVESDVPEGWVKVPAEMWNKLIQENETFEAALNECGEEKKLEDRARAFRNAAKIYETAATSLEKAVAALNGKESRQDGDDSTIQRSNDPTVNR